MNCWEMRIFWVWWRGGDAGSMGSSLSRGLPTLATMTLSRRRAPDLAMVRSDLGRQLYGLGDVLWLILKSGTVRGGSPALLVIDCTNSRQYGQTFSIPFDVANALMSNGSIERLGGNRYAPFRRKLMEIALFELSPTSPVSAKSKTNSRVDSDVFFPSALTLRVRET
jgi:hypothetical protein